MGPLALGVALPGLQCTQCGVDDDKKKGRLAGAGGALFLLAGEVALGPPSGPPPIWENSPRNPPVGRPL